MTAPSEAPRLSDEEEVSPNPASLIESLRSFGYGPATAIADLIDNSITAGASSIDVNLEWAGPDSFVTVLDDGQGMTEDELRSAMRAGSSHPGDERTPQDLGRFGLGLKTASFSQGRSLTVISKRSQSTPCIRRWDLDHVGQRNRWALLKTLPDGADDHLATVAASSHGTLVLWRKLDRVVDDRPANDRRATEAFFAMVDSVRFHCEVVFHRFIAEDGLGLTVNGQVCQAWDPFLSDHPDTEQLPDETIPIALPSGRSQNLVIKPYVLPHNSKLSDEQHRRAAGPKGWNLHQGFYLYRARRLIVAGDWFNPGIKPEEHYKLARVRVEITQEMDSDWSLDVRKARARPPANLRDDFLRIARAARAKAQDVYRSRGSRAVGQRQRSPITPVWRALSKAGRLEYEINRDHAIVTHMLKSASPAQLRGMRAVLNLLERNLPIAHIISSGYSDEEHLPLEPDEIGDELRRVLQDVFCQMCAGGMPEDQARELLLKNQPFDRFPELVEPLDARDCT